MASLSDFAVQKARVLPVIIAVDRSGSMSKDDKIGALNLALKNCINSLREWNTYRVEIQVALYSFGGDGVTCDCGLMPAGSVSFREYQAYGGTPIGMTLTEIKSLIEDREQIPSRSYAPTVVLLTDGVATDATAVPLDAFVKEGRSAKAFRIAMAIGDDADMAFLQQYVSEPEYLVTGESAADIKNFFKFVTMSVSQRSTSATPNSMKLSVKSTQSSNDNLIF